MLLTNHFIAAAIRQGVAISLLGFLDSGVAKQSAVAFQIPRFVTEKITLGEEPIGFIDFVRLFLQQQVEQGQRIQAPNLSSPHFIVVAIELRDVRVALRPTSPPIVAQPPWPEVSLLISILMQEVFNFTSPIFP